MVDTKHKSENERKEKERRKCRHYPKRKKLRRDKTPTAKHFSETAHANVKTLRNALQSMYSANNIKNIQRNDRPSRQQEQ